MIGLKKIRGREIFICCVYVLFIYLIDLFWRVKCFCLLSNVSFVCCKFIVGFCFYFCVEKKIFLFFLFKVYY